MRGLSGGISKMNPCRPNSCTGIRVRDIEISLGRLVEYEIVSFDKAKNEFTCKRD